MSHSAAEALPNGPVCVPDTWSGAETEAEETDDAVWARSMRLAQQAVEMKRLIAVS